MATGYTVPSGRLISNQGWTRPGVNVIQPKRNREVANLPPKKKKKIVLFRLLRVEHGLWCDTALRQVA